MGEDIHFAFGVINLFNCLSRYERSPYNAKIRHILTLKDIPYRHVEVSWRP
jgi:hypothetical protein